MANDIKIATQNGASFTITLASLASGSARQSTMITNTTPGYPGAIIYLKISSGGSAPTAGAVYEVYLLRSDETPSISDDAAGTSDAAITIENAILLDTIVVTATTNKAFYKTIDTIAAGMLGPKWGIAIKNSSGQALHATEGNHLYEYVYYNSQVQ